MTSFNSFQGHWFYSFLGSETPNKAYIRWVGFVSFFDHFSGTQQHTHLPNQNICAIILQSWAPFPTRLSPRTLTSPPPTTRFLQPNLHQPEKCRGAACFALSKAITSPLSTFHPPI